MSQIKHLAEVKHDSSAMIEEITDRITAGLQTITQGELHLLLKANQLDIVETLHCSLYLYNNIQLRIL